MKLKKNNVMSISRQPFPVQVMIESEILSSLGKLITSESNSGLPWEKRHSTIRRLKFTEETSKVQHLEHSFFGVEIWILRKVDRKYLETAEMWCWSRKEHICWTDSVENEVLHSQ